MKKKQVFLILIMCLAAVAMLTACNKQLTQEDVQRMYGDWIEVTYNIGDGNWRGRESVDVTFRYKPSENGSVAVLEPGTGKLTKAEPRMTGYFLEGWYTDENFTAKWDFAKDKTDKAITLYARWMPNYRYTFYYVENNAVKKVEGSDYEVLQGYTLPESVTPQREGYTFLGQCYSDPECKVKWDYTVPHPGRVENGVQLDVEVPVYTQWLEGSYTLVYNAGDMVGIGYNNFYLMNDIDFAEVYEGTTERMYNWGGDSAEFAGIIKGNGYKIKNIELKFPDEMGINGRAERYGLFASLKSGAVLEDVTFENVKITVNDGSEFRRSLGLVAGLIEEGVKFSNVKVTGTLELVRVHADYELGLIAGEIGGDMQTTLAGLTTSLTLVTDKLEGFTATYDNVNEITLTAKA